jgi:hypothetical protein
MGDSTWTHKKRKNGKWYSVIVVLLIVSVAAVILRNNPELLTLYNKNGAHAVKAAVPAVSKVEAAGPHMPLAAPVAAPVKAASPTPVPAVRDSVIP